MNNSLAVITFEAGEGMSGFDISSFDIQKKSSWTYDPGTGLTTVLAGASLIEITVRRLQLAQAFTVCLLIINLALTIGSAYVTLLTIIRRETVNDTILLLSVTVVLEPFQQKNHQSSRLIHCHKTPYVSAHALLYIGCTSQGSQ